MCIKIGKMYITCSRNTWIASRKVCHITRNTKRKCCMLHVLQTHVVLKTLTCSSNSNIVHVCHMYQ